MTKNTPQLPPNSAARRLLLSSLVSGGAFSSGWVTPVVESLLLPAHAQSSQAGLGRHPGTGTTLAARVNLNQNPQVVGQNTDICDANPFSLRSDSRISVLIRQHSSYQYRYGFIYYDDYSNNNIAATLPPSNPNGTSEGQALLLLQVVAPLQVKVENIGHGSAWEVRSAVLDVGKYYGGASDTYRYQLTVFNNEVSPRTRHDTYVVFALSIDAESGATFVQGQIGPDCVTGSLATTAAPLIATTPDAPTTPAATTTTTTTTPAPTTPTPTPSPTSTPAPTTPTPTPSPTSTPAPTTPTPTPSPTSTPAPPPRTKLTIRIVGVDAQYRDNLLLVINVGGNPGNNVYGGPFKTSHTFNNVRAGVSLGTLEINMAITRGDADIFATGLAAECDGGRCASMEVVKYTEFTRGEEVTMRSNQSIFADDPVETIVTVTLSNFKLVEPTSLMVKVWESVPLWKYNGKVKIELGKGRHKKAYYDGPANAQQTYVLRGLPSNTDLGSFSIRLSIDDDHSFAPGASARCHELCKSADVTVTHNENTVINLYSNESESLMLNPKNSATLSVQVDNLGLIR